MTANRYDTNNDMVRYENTANSLTTSEQREEKRIIDMMYAFDEDLSQSLAKIPHQNDKININPNCFNNFYDSYFNTNSQKSDFFKNDGEVICTDRNEPTEQKPPAKIFKKKIVSNDSMKIKKVNTVSSINNVNANTPSGAGTKFDLNKFKVDPPQTAPTEKVIINNVNNNNNNNYIITSINQFNNEEEEEDVPLTSSIINSIKKRKTAKPNLKKKNTVTNFHNINTINSELECDSEKIQYNASKPRRRKSTDLPNNRRQKEEYDLEYVPKNNNRSIVENYEMNIFQGYTLDKSKDLNMSEDIEMKYLSKLSKLKKENEEMKAQISSISQLQSEISELKEKYDIKNKECINYKSSYDTIAFEYDILSKKHEELKNKFKNHEIISNENEDLKIENKSKTDKINELMAKIEKIEKENNELKSTSQDDKNGIREFKTSYESMKNNYNDMKHQYDLLMLKMQNLNEENFSLKRELILFKGKTEDRPLKKEEEPTESPLETEKSRTPLGAKKNKSKSFANLAAKKAEANQSTQEYSLPKERRMYQNKSNINLALEDQPEVPSNTITKSRRRPITSNTNDSSGVGSLLSFQTEQSVSPPLKPKIKNQFETSYPTIVTKKLSPAEIIEKETQANQIEAEILQYQQQKERYTNELNKLPEHPKHKSVILQKRNIELEIENLSIKISNCRKELREINKAIY